MNAITQTLGQSRAFTRPLPFVLVLSLVAFSGWTLLRLFLWLEVGPEELTLRESASGFLLGSWFDLWTLAYLVSPLLLVSSLLGNRLRASSAMQAARCGLLWLAVAALLFGITAEYLFWQEFTTRFNFIAIDYLIYTNEVIGNIQESYPVGMILTGIGLIAALVVWLCCQYVQFDIAPRSGIQRLHMLGIALTLPLAANILADLDQTRLSGNNYAQELAGNGLYTLAAAMRRNDLDYDRFYQTIPNTVARQTLDTLGLRRDPAAKLVSYLQPPSEPMGPFHKRPRNVVLITVESLSARYLGAYGNTQQLTPNLDRLAREGYRFDKLYATGTRTVRGLEALSLGTPPIPGQAIVRRPHNQHLATIGEYLEAQHYTTQFVYGGYGYFDNMNAYFSGNDYQVLDRTDFDPRHIAAENIWGVADETLFDNALQALDQDAAQRRPFFMQIMTTSNHRPYTFPAGRIDLPQGTRKAAVKYTDYAIGRFIAQASSKPWFDDTLFVIVADHCASVAGRTSLPVDKYHIPMIFYAPHLLQPGRHTLLASQIDLAPTLLDLLGARGSEQFFGQNLFDTAHYEERAFISNYQSLGYYKHDRLVVLSPKHEVETFKVDPENFRTAPDRAQPELRREAIAYYQTASEAYKSGGLNERALQTQQQALPQRTMVGIAR
jgi:phosphoglycerol transferase MdoB-like AlkP superfamily enzyme